MSQKIITPSIEVELQPFTFYNVNNETGALKIFMATTQVEALKQKEEYLKTLETNLPTTKEN